MMLTLAVFYDIPQLNLGTLFSNNKDVSSEKVRLAGSGYGTQYGVATPGLEDSQYEDNSHRQVIRFGSRRDASPSPDEALPKDFRLP